MPRSQGACASPKPGLVDAVLRHPGVLDPAYFCSTLQHRHRGATPVRSASSPGLSTEMLKGMAADVLQNLPVKSALRKSR